MLNRAHDESQIGQPIAYTDGPLKDRTVRCELIEYQKPDLGRKFAKRDRRPLDPPPVIRVRQYEIFDAGTPQEREEEITAQEINVTGFVAHVDLFAAPPPESDTLKKVKTRRDITSGENLTSSLFGSTFVHATQMKDEDGVPVVFFVFADLSVKMEGYFKLRYRCFDILSASQVGSTPIAAELHSGVFVVYSTKEFPGLQASTALTRHLSRWGVKVNLREERPRKGDKGGGRGGDSSSDDEKEEVTAPVASTSASREAGTEASARDTAATSSITHQEGAGSSNEPTEAPPVASPSRPPPHSHREPHGERMSLDEPRGSVSQPPYTHSDRRGEGPSRRESGGSPTMPSRTSYPRHNPGPYSPREGHSPATSRENTVVRDDPRVGTSPGGGTADPAFSSRRHRPSPAPVIMGSSSAGYTRSPVQSPTHARSRSPPSPRRERQIRSTSIGTAVPGYRDYQHNLSDQRRRSQSRSPTRSNRRYSRTSPSPTHSRH
ncbi:hypothetical protein BOTBODRAFT_28767 [Botryobasidium botryosum FD-172 SS1]|uniref:Velvet domain-containing protein n=1 Tax=Botryobasidium botryosum (strain FD-172 SS1) TaxID=930990 RepID=A0A067MRK6_BOTB1|nr:hypothetical protein BOTBODRAFT_28767 [Botryobasidium botryosum FD-172 SS1]